MRTSGLRLVCTGLVATVLVTGGCASRTYLWNGKDFTGWRLFAPDENVDVHDVWSVADGVIHCKGKPQGYMRTEAEYSNYKLHLEWRWAEKPTNSGVLVHMTGPDKVWPRSIECQLMHENAGDFWIIGGAAITVDGKRISSSADKASHGPKKRESSEKPPGDWNSYDIYCHGGAVRCHVNDVLQNEGTNASSTCGKICLQSEGSPIEFRNIYIEPLK